MSSRLDRRRASIGQAIGPSRHDAHGAGVHRSRGWRAASVWSSRRTGVRHGRVVDQLRDSSRASRAIWIIASQNSSSVSFDSVSVGSIISASSTISGK